MFEASDSAEPTITILEGPRTDMPKRLLESRMLACLESDFNGMARGVVGQFEI